MADRIVYEKLGPGKFSDTVAEALYEMTMEGADEEVGDVQDFGWYGFLDFRDEPIEVEEDGEVTKYYGAIVNEDNSGFFSHKLYTHIDMAILEWSDVMEEAAEFYGEDEEDEDEDDDDDD